jgi:hypothetical protein
MEDSELVAAVRAECGKVNDDETLDNADVLRESNWILKRIDEKITDRKVRSFLSEADEREYSPHDNTVRVQRVFPFDTLGSDPMNFGSQYGRTVFDPEASDFYLWPSLYVIAQQRRLAGLPPFRWEWNHIRRKIIIDPMPTVGDEKYWYVSIERVEWTLANLPESFEELLVTGTTWKCLEIVLLKRSDLGGIQRAGGFIDYPASTLKPFVDDKRDAFYDILRMKVQLYGIK